jgi:nucleoside-diphosphate-sugar epimerase
MFRALDAPGGRVRIFGRDATRDFTFVDDVVRYLVAAERARGQVVNLASGTETRIVDLAASIAALREKPRDAMILDAPRPWDRVVRRCADVTRLRSLFDDVPATSLEDGLRATHDWLVARRHLRGLRA